MSDIIRHCPDCGRDCSLEQHHRIAAWCPDTADGYCPEWFCQFCGAALLIGDIPIAREPVLPVAIRDRVA
jgi:hypothetical protein